MSTRLPQGSLILISGANGLIASHTADQLLSLGYRVRGTVRDVEKNAWLQEYFDGKHGPGKFELFGVRDFSAPGSFDEAIKGASGFGSIASDMSMDTDPEKTVTPVLRAVQNSLAAAASEPGLRTFVLTSSSMAASRPLPGKKFRIGVDTWNERDVAEAWAPAWSDRTSRRWATYGASKTQGEQAVWRFRRERRPAFAVATVLPNANFGPILAPDRQQGSTAAWIKMAYDADRWPQIRDFVPPQYFVDVRDTARLHAALLTDTKYDGERLFAYAETFTWNGVLARLRKLTPDKTLPEDLDDDSEDLSEVENQRALAILTERFGQTAWTPIEESLKENVKAVA